MEDQPMTAYPLDRFVTDLEAAIAAAGDNDLGEAAPKRAQRMSPVGGG